MQTTSQHVSSLPQGTTHWIPGPAGIQLHTSTYGDHSANRHLLMIHGGYQAKECFREQYSVLAEAGCYVVAFDLPWHGMSGPSLKQHDLVLTLDIWAESITAVRKHFQLADSLVILAWSLGGLIVRKYIHNNGTNGIGKLILVAPLLDLAEGMEAVQKYRPESLSLFEQLSTDQGHFRERTTAFLSFFEKLSASPPQDSNAHYLTLGYNARSFLSMPPSFNGALASFAPGDVGTFLGQLNCPVLFVQGTQDELVPSQYTRSNVARIREERVTLLELPCGHSPFLELSEQFNTAVLQFLEKDGAQKKDDVSHPSLPQRALEKKYRYSPNGLIPTS